MGQDPHKFYEDGYYPGGTQGPLESADLDPLIWPERPPPDNGAVAWVDGETYEQYEQRCSNEAAKEEQRRLTASRDLSITEDSALGCPMTPWHNQPK